MGFNGGTPTENVAKSAVKVLEVEVLFSRARTRRDPCSTL